MRLFTTMRLYIHDKVRFNEYRAKLQQLYPTLRPSDADVFGFLLNVAEAKCPMYSKIEESGLKKLCLSHKCPTHELSCTLQEGKVFRRAALVSFSKSEMKQS